MSLKEHQVLSHDVVRRPLRLAGIWNAAHAAVLQRSDFGNCIAARSSRVGRPHANTALEILKCALAHGEI